MNAAKRVVNADPELALPQDVLGILETVIEERDRAMAKWGVQSHPDGTGGGAAEILRDAAIAETEEAAANGTVTWKQILFEEVREAFAESDLVALDNELMQVMQVCCVWREDIARRRQVSLLGTTFAEHDRRVEEALSYWPGLRGGRFGSGGPTYPSLAICPSSIKNPRNPSFSLTMGWEGSWSLRRRSGMKFGGTSMIGETMSKSWLGSIQSIVLDWHEGVFVESIASPHGDPRLPSSVYYDAKCCLCEWAYEEGGPLEGTLGDVLYGFQTPDVEEVLRWATNHRVSQAHTQAVFKFRFEKKKEGSDKAGQRAENTGDK